MIHNRLVRIGSIHVYLASLVISRSNDFVRYQGVYDNQDTGA